MGLFGPSQAEIWRALCEQLGATYVDGGFWKGGRVVARQGGWEVVLDTYTVSTGNSTVVYTRMRAPFHNSSGFRFKIYREGLFSTIGKWFGMADVEVGYPAFDQAFVIQGTDEAGLVSLFANARVRELLESQPRIALSIKADEGFFGTRFPEGVDELYFEVAERIRDVERLRLLFELFYEVLMQLATQGVATLDAPEVALK